MNSLKTSNTVSVILLVFFTIGLFINTLRNDFTLDDAQVVLNSPFLAGDWGWRDILNEGRPIRTVSLMFDYTISGSNPAGYHLQNVIWHLFNTILLYFFVLNIAGDRRLALVASLLFSSHPIHVESVANIANRKDLLAFFFMFASLLLYMKSYSFLGYRRFILIGGSMIAFFIALLSKQAGAVLPILIIAYEAYFVPKGKRLILDNIPYISPLIFLLLLYGLRYISPAVQRFMSSPIPYTDVLFTSIKSIGYYCRLLLWPANLSADHVTIASKTLLDPKVVFSLTTLALLLATIVWTRSSSRLLSFGLLWFVVNLLPVSNLIPGTAGFFVAERYMYIPSVGFVVVSGMALQSISTYKERSALYLLALILIFFSWNTIDRNTVWKNNFALWTDTLKKDPDSILAKVNMGDIYRANEMPEKAVPYYLDALRKLPDDPGIRNNLGLSYMKLGRYDEAMGEYEKVLRVAPEFTPSIYSLAEILALKGRYVDALTLYKRILNIPVSNRKVSPLLKVKVHLQIGMLYSKMGQKKEALDELEKFVSEWKGRKEDMTTALDEIERLKLK